MAASISLSSVVRTVLVEGGNKPQRLSNLWAEVQARAPELAKSKTHFKTAVIANMFRREQVSASRFSFFLLCA